MGPVPKNTKFHFTHPNHPLIYQSDDQDYFCDGCKTAGSGSRFRCDACDFDLHEFCANCPEKLSSYIHHHHLALNLLKPEPAALGVRFCDICLDPIHGLFYRCSGCDFDAHPICTQLPNELRHVIDNNHSLKLRKLSFGSCVVCKTDCSSLWVYGCDICRVNIHLDCLLEPFDHSLVSPPSQGHGPSGCSSRGIPFAPPPWPTGPPPVHYGFDPFGKPYPFGDFGFGGHSSYPFPVPYGVPGYPFGHPYGFPHQSAYNNYVNYHQATPSGYAAPPRPPPPPSPPPSSGGRKVGKKMFSLVGRLTFGVLTSFIFGFPIGF